MNRIFTTALIILISAASCSQPATKPAASKNTDLPVVSDSLPGVPGRYNYRTDTYPRVLEDNSVLFGMYAPQAKKVEMLMAFHDPQPMQRGKDGTWTVRTEPLQPGFHYYMFRVDGAGMNDLWARSFRAWGHEECGIEIPVPDSEWMEWHDDVPHGRCSEETYRSGITGGLRHICVYTPAGYEAHPEKRYPVIYVLHGTGEDHRAWMEQGRVPDIMDNLIAGGEAVPMIVVTMNSNLYDDRQPYTREDMVPYEHEILETIIPFVDARYRTIPDSGHRAMCGLSRGAGETFVIGLSQPETFSSCGIFSSGLFAADGGAELARNAAHYNQCFKHIYFTCGDIDPRCEKYDATLPKLREAGLNFEYDKFPGHHEWQPWRNSIREFAKKLFK